MRFQRLQIHTAAAVLKAANLRCDTEAQMHQHLSHSRRGLDRVSTFDSRSSPYGRPSQHAPVNRTQPKTAEYQGSLIIADQSHGRAHIDPSVLLDPNPISASDSRISLRKQVVRQAGTIRVNPETAESRGSQTMTSQPPNRPRPRSRTKPNLAPESPNQSKTAAPATDNRRPHTAGNGGIPRFVDYNRPVAQPGAH